VPELEAKLDLKGARLLIFGLGYSGTAIAAAAVAAGATVTVTSRTPERMAAPAGVSLIGFDAASPAVAAATHVLSTAAPTETGDPVLARYGQDIHAASSLVWLGYLSTTGVYGDRAGGWVDETTAPAPRSARGARRVAAEQAWVDAAAGRPIDLFRLAGIYGPGRSALDDLRAGRARRVIKPGHAFGRIHRDDIAHAVVAAMRRPDGARVLNLVDDLPAETADVVAEAAALLGLPVPPGVPFEEARRAMSPMALSFWEENRRVANDRTKAALGIEWLFPTYREGLRDALRKA
jgi:nucleoside-diphosphate-sugar epimerase